MKRARSHHDHGPSALTFQGMTTHASTSNLPTPAEYAAAVTALVTAQETVEALTWRLRETVDSYEEAETPATPTAEDVVAVFTLVDELERTKADLDANLLRLQDMLGRINLARLNAP
jgi:hypothetical protein